MLQVRRLPAQAGPVVDNLAVDFSGSVIDEGHMALTLLSLEKTVDVFIRNFSERRIFILEVGFADLVDHRQKLVSDLLASQLHQSKTRTFVENDDQQQPADYRDVDAFALAFVRKSGELLFTYQLRHASSRGYVSGGQRGQ